MSRERLHGKVRWKSLQDEHVQRYRVSFPDSFKGIRMCLHVYCLVFSPKTMSQTTLVTEKVQKFNSVALGEVKLWCGGEAEKQAQTR